jgi:hypothetical protein
VGPKLNSGEGKEGVVGFGGCSIRYLRLELLSPALSNLNWNCSIYWQIKLKKMRKIINIYSSEKIGRIFFCLYRRLGENCRPRQVEMSWWSGLFANSSFLNTVPPKMIPIK